MDHERHAKALAERLLKNVGGGKRVYLSQPLDIYVADVEAAADRFDAQLQFCLRFKLGFPCVFIPALVPVDWSSIIPSLKTDSWRWLTRVAEPGRFEKAWHSLPSFGRFGGIKLVRPLDALRSLREGLVQFLTVRFSARKSNISAGPGLRFRVITRTHGLRVHWSPAYFFNPNNVFGSPTSPVDGWIQPGKYKFGAVGPNFPLRFDSATFNIPPLTQATLVRV
jgi:hypothetical protein